jgi:hypothetical protein
LPVRECIEGFRKSAELRNGPPEIIRDHVGTGFKEVLRSWPIRLDFKSSISQEGDLAILESH